MAPPKKRLRLRDLLAFLTTYSDWSLKHAGGRYCLTFRRRTRAVELMDDVGEDLGEDRRHVDGGAPRVRVGRKNNKVTALRVAVV
jgi:hypothetical protein